MRNEIRVGKYDHLDVPVYRDRNAELSKEAKRCQAPGQVTRPSTEGAGYRGDSVMTGYYEMPQALAEAIDAGGKIGV